MANAQLKVSGTTEITSISGNNILYVVNTAAGANGSCHITIDNFLGNSTVNVATQVATPANSTITIKQGTILVDTDYLYVAVANNTLKRVALDTF